jgi:hypothetical protein
MLTLSEATKTGQLQQFIDQEEARGIGPINRAKLDRCIQILIRAKQSKDQTSRSSCVDSSTGKRTRQGSDPYADR